jgi:hypothetical protein
MDPIIQFPCPVCGERLKATPDQAGRAGKCPICDHKSVVPAQLRDSRVAFSTESVEGYCSKCGARAVGNFCSRCGFRLTWEPDKSAIPELNQPNHLADRLSALAPADASAEAIEQLRAALLDDMTNLELRKQYLRVRTPDMRLLDESVHSDPPPIPAEVRSQAMIYYLVISGIGIVLGAMISPIMIFCLGGFGIWIGYKIASEITTPARAAAEEHLAALRARCAELGPLPDDAPTDPVAARQRFLSA